MHPSSALLVCLIAVVAIQFLGLAGLALVASVLLTLSNAGGGWWRLLRRMRWLLLSVWLILAYGSSGDALFDFAWMPTYEGVREASLHVARLALMLGCLAWLFAFLGNHGLLVALQSMLHPFCLLYTSDAADERSSVDLGGRRIIKKNNQSYHRAILAVNHTYTPTTNVVQ